jgi:hypothetical protein
MTICDAPTSVLHYLQICLPKMDDLGDNLISHIDRQNDDMQTINGILQKFDLHYNSKEDFIDSLITYIDN